MAQQKSIRQFARKAQWKDLEEHARQSAQAIANPDVVNAVTAVPLDDYEIALRELIRRAYEKASQSSMQALYFEFDMDNEWHSAIFLCKEYEPESKADDEWAADFSEDITGPELPPFGDIYGDHAWGDSRPTKSIERYLIARTLAAVGRAASGLDLKGVALCVGYHDQDLVYRVRELPPSERIRRKPQRFAYYRIECRLPPGYDLAHRTAGPHYGCDFQRKGHIGQWQTPVYKIAGKFADLLEGTDRALLCSPRLRQMIDQHRGERDVIQWLDVDVESKENQVRRYSLLHLPELLDVLDQEHSKIMEPAPDDESRYVAVPCLRRAAAEDHHVFAVMCPPPLFGVNGTFVSDEMRKAINSLTPTGILFRGVACA